MDRRTPTLVFPSQATLEFTGERYVPGIGGQIQYEHFHRYLLAAQHVVGKRVLDIACGEGYGSWAMSRLADRVCGVDIASDAVDHARKTYASPNLEFETGSITAIPYDDAVFDIAICFETIEHVQGQTEAMIELRRVLRPGGILLISSPNARADDGAWHERNPFHEKELTLDEFLVLLSGPFNHVRVAEQRFLHGSVLAEMGALSQDDERASFKAEDGVNFAAVRGHIGESYFVAICSDQPVPSLGLTILDAERDLHALESQFRQIVEQVHDQDRVFARIQADLEQVRSELAESQATGSRREADLEQIRSELAEAQATGSRREADLDQLRRWRRLAQIQIANLRARANACKDS